jgi:hypothetical protein
MRSPNGPLSQRIIFTFYALNVGRNQSDRLHVFSQQNSTTGRFQTYPSTWYFCQLVSARTTQKELTTRKIHRRDYRTLPKNPDFSETTRMLIKSTQISKKDDNNSENKIVSITNIFKGYKITDLTRPN